MTVTELISTLQSFPPLMEVYVQTISTGLNKIDGVKKDNGLGIVELKWNTKNVMPPEPSVYTTEKPIDVFDIKPAPSSADVNWSTYEQGNITGLDWLHRETSTIPPKKDLYYGD